MDFKHTLNLDLETFSSVDLKKCGMYKYVESPDFEILMIAYSIDGGEVEIIDMRNLTDDEYHKLHYFESFLYSEKVKKIAYNAQFERICFERHYGKVMPPEQWECTMIKGAMLGLPMGLASIATVLQLDQQKDFAGANLIRYFCLPCKPSKVNGERTRNLPHHAPEKWEAFKSYCKDDVRTEMAVGKALSFFEIPVKEKLLWDLDQQINGYGVMLDKRFARMAVEMDEKVKAKLTEEAMAITKLDNPNSVSKLLRWLSDETGDELTTLKKADVPLMLKKYEDEKVTRMLEIRQEMAKTSVKKYLAMMNTVCADGRIRGLFQFYGARTGRHSGRLVQMQNLPQNHLIDLDLARELVREGDLETVEMAFGNVPDTLSQLIRTAFVAPKGKIFGVFDFSAIEARVIAWCANEQWRLDVFNTHGKIYEASASKMFNVPIESVTKGSDLRQKGKVAELACIAKDQLVLTDRGLVPIQDVKLVDKVFDGTRFCRHKGVIFKGTKKVIEYEGLIATTDHLVWVEGKSEPIQFGVAAASGSRLLRPVLTWESIWERGNNKRREALDGRLGMRNGFYQMHQMSEHAMDQFQQFEKREVERMPAMFQTEASTQMVGPPFNRSQAEMRKPVRQKLSQLRREGNTVQFQIGTRGGSVSFESIPGSSETFGIGSDKQQWPLRKRKSAFYKSNRQCKKPTENSYTLLEPESMALLVQRSIEIFKTRYDEGRNYIAGTESCDRQAKKLARDCGEVEVYDIAYCGPNNRYVVSGALVHNCGYGGGQGALINMGALKMGVAEEDLQGLIDAWRTANPSIVKLWKNCENAMLSAVQGQPILKFPHVDLKFYRKKDYLFMELPSGRAVAYYKPIIKENRFGKGTVAFHGTDTVTKKWGVIETYGGRVVENLCQAIARDCLAETLLAVNEHGYRTVAHVHDEIIVELDCETAEKDFEIIKNIMGTEVKWGKGLPLTADGYLTKFYKKD